MKEYNAPYATFNMRCKKAGCDTLLHFKVQENPSIETEKDGWIEVAPYKDMKVT